MTLLGNQIQQLLFSFPNSPGSLSNAERVMLFLERMTKNRHTEVVERFVLEQYERGKRIQEKGQRADINA